MKTVNRILLIILAIVSIFVAFAITVFFIVFPSNSSSALTSVVNMINPLGDDFKISIGSLDEGALDSVSINSLVVDSDDASQIQIDNVKLSIGLMDLMKLKNAKEYQEVKVDVSGADVILTEDLLRKYLPQNVVEVVSENTATSSNNSEIVSEVVSEQKEEVGSFENVCFDVSVKDLNASLNFQGNDFKLDNADVLIKYQNGQISDITVESKKLSGSISFIGSEVVLEDVQVYGQDLNNLNFSLGRVATQYNENDVLISNVSGSYKPNEIVVNLEGLQYDGFPVVRKADAVYSNEVFDGTIHFDQFESSVKYNTSSKEFYASVFFEDFILSEYRELVLKYVPQINWMILDTTALNGNCTVEGILDFTQPVLNFNSNLSFSDIPLNDKLYNFDFAIGGEYQRNQISFNSLVLDLTEYKLIFNGVFNLDSFLPVGNLSVVTNNTQLGSVDFDLIDGNYCYKIHTSTFENIVISGDASYDSQKQLISSNAQIDTGLQSFPLGIRLSLSNQSIQVNGENVFFDGNLKDSILFGELEIKDFIFELNENFALTNSGIYKGQFDLKTHDYSGSIDGFEILVSDIATVGFNVNVVNQNIKFSNLSVGVGETDFFFDGEAEITYEFMIDFLKNPEKISFVFDFNRRGTNQYLKGSFFDLAYNAQLDLFWGTNLKVDLLGNMGNGFFAHCNIGDVVFEAKYIDKEIILFDGQGSIGSFSLNDFYFDVDYYKRTLNGFVVIHNTLDNHEGPVNRHARIDFTGKLDSINLSAFSIDNIDAVAEVDVALSDAYIGEDFPIKDNKFNLSYSNHELKIVGDLINGSYNNKTKYFDIDVNKNLIFGFNASGIIGEELDLYAKDLYIPLDIINQFINWPFFHAYSGNLTGDLLVKGSPKDPSFYGMLYCSVFDMGLFWIPFQRLSLKGLSISLIDHDITLAPLNLIGQSSLDGRIYNATFDAKLSLDNWTVSELNMNLGIHDKPIDFWLPIKSNNREINFNGDVLGDMNFSIQNGAFTVTAKLFAENSILSLKFPEYTPDWYYDFSVLSSADMDITTGKNVDFYYPNKDNYLLTFTTEENNNVHFVFDSISNKLTANGKFLFKTGEIYYFKNSFKISEGSLAIGQKPFAGNELDFTINLRAKLREYDSNGVPNDIFLVLNNSSLENLNPKLEASTGISENQIVQLLGQAVVNSDTQVTPSSVASLAVTATNTAIKLGLIDFDNDLMNSLSSSIKDSLKLDIFSIRSPIIEKIIVEALPGENNNISLLSRYLNGTSLFAGKYLMNDTFAKMTVLLRSNDKNSKNGNFISDDLSLDLEFSFDWDNPVGSFSVFIQPNELSVVNFLDTIGFSYTKTFKF